MKQLNIEFENCYGIEKLKYNFIFESKDKDVNQNIYAIYASNGSMKTSFTKTLLDYSQEQPSLDRVFNSKSTRDIYDDKNQKINTSDIFIIESYNENICKEGCELLTIENSCLTQYNEAYRKIEEVNKNFEKSLKKDIGLNFSDVLTTLNLNSKVDFVEYFKNNKQYLTETNTIPYNIIFNKKVEDFLLNNKELLSAFFDEYEKILKQKNAILSKDFNYKEAINIKDKLKSLKFFDIGHSILLNGSNEPIKDHNSFNDAIENFISSIVNNTTIDTLFKQIEMKTSENDNMRNFKNYFMNNKEEIIFLKDIEAIKTECLIASIFKIKNLDELINIYNENIDTIITLQNKAEDNQHEWQKVITEFNIKFKVPFSLTIEKRKNNITEKLTPNVGFIFEKNNNKTTTLKNTLFEVMSQGEKRAFYLLNIMFNIQQTLNKIKLSNLNSDLLLVIDDIADSFDYKNKYAILEYLKELSSNEKIKMIILTHNFDFYRSVCQRLKIPRSQSLTSLKNNKKNELVETKYQGDVLEKTFKKQMHQTRFFLASISFARQLAMYCGYNKEEEKMHHLLHIKQHTKTMTIRDIKNIFKIIFIDPAQKDKIDKVNNDNLLYWDSLGQETNKIINNIKTHNNLPLEDKIILSIFIRLKAEEFMFETLNKEDMFIHDIKNNQTKELFDLFLTIKNLGIYSNELNLLKQVNLLTPEHIHLNSFMYEPLLDTCGGKLIELTTDIINIF